MLWISKPCASLAATRSSVSSAKVSACDSGQPLQIKNLVNLRWLNVSSTVIYDLSPLEDLKDLQTLDISSTIVNDLYPLKKLLNLVELNASLTN